MTLGYRAEAEVFGIKETDGDVKLDNLIVSEGKQKSSERDGCSAETV